MLEVENSRAHKHNSTNKRPFHQARHSGRRKTVGLAILGVVVLHCSISAFIQVFKATTEGKLALYLKTFPRQMYISTAMSKVDYLEN